MSTMVDFDSSDLFVSNLSSPDRCVTMVDIAVTLRAELKKNEHVVFAYLFGSVARNQTHPFSDVDVAVFLDEYTSGKFIDILNSTSDVVGDNVDLVILNHAPPLLKLKVVSEGILLFTRSNKVHTEFYTNALIEGLDFKDSFEIYKQAVRKRLGIDQSNHPITRPTGRSKGH